MFIDVFVVTYVYSLVMERSGLAQKLVINIVNNGSVVTKYFNLASQMLLFLISCLNFI